MSKASEYEIKVTEEGCYLCKTVPSLEAKGQLSQDKRPLTKNEILSAFYWFFTDYCKENRTNIYRLYNGRKMMFEARRPRRRNPKTKQ